jgi:hypothetical protein
MAENYPPPEDEAFVEEEEIDDTVRLLLRILRRGGH